ncbi:MAG: carboxypeptidase regulatory-like domain-containing protein [Planctomycetes bacterium]|nr:carboxypeptidase regulatory-like domain-containing protein [Planctomycetota bacterium]
MKPIAVLLLVLAAVGALIFGLVTLGGGKGTPTPNVVPEATPESAKPTPKPAEIEKGDSGSTRKADPVEPTAERNEVGNFVYANEVRVLVVNDKHAPVADVEVTLTTLSSTDIFTSFVDSADQAYQVGPLRTGPDGRVSFQGIQPRHNGYTLVCVHPDYARQERATVPIEQDGVIEEPPIVLTTGATLQGLITDEQGGAIAGANLVLEGLLASVQESRAPDRLVGVSDASGKYTLPNIPRGAMRNLTINAPGFGRMVVTQLSFPTVAPVTRNFTLKVAEMITGRVVGLAGEALPKVKLVALGVSGSMQNARDETVSDERGEFRFESLAPGDFNVIAALKGWRFQPQNRIHTNTANLTFEGSRMSSVCGQVVDAATGAAITNFSAQLRNFNDVVSPTSPIPDSKANFSDAGGNFCLEGVEIGNYVVEAWAEGYAPTRSPNFTVTQDRNVEHIAVRLTRGGSISGRLVDSDNKPIAKARVRTKPNDWGEDEFSTSIEDIYPSNVTQREVRTGSDGSFSLTGLAPDTYQLIIEGSGFSRSSKADIAVTEGTNNNLSELVMQSGGSLLGTVYDATGKGVSGASVVAVSADNGAPRQYTTKSGADGKFSLRNIAQGRYRVRPSPAAGPDVNPLEQMRIGGDAEKQITIIDRQESTIDLTLPVSAPPPAPPVEEAPVPLPPGGGRPPSGKRP